MRYLFLICGDQDTLDRAPDLMAEQDPPAWMEEMQARGIRQLGARLRPAAEAITQRTRDGELLLADGPFAETAEVVGGFDVMECADLDEAIEVAAKHPFAALGSIEIRPLWDE
jgi:hypothetical protein